MSKRLTSVQNAQIQKYLRDKKALKFCFVCNEADSWEYSQMIVSDGYSGGRRQVGEGVISVVVECKHCGHQLLVSAARLGLV